MSLRLIKEKVASPRLQAAAGWQVLRLGDVCEIQNGYAFESSLFSVGEGMPLVRIRDLRTNIPSVRFTGDYEDRYIVTANDLLVGMDGEFRCYRWDGPPALLNQRVCRLLPCKERLDPSFLYFALNDYLSEIEQRTAFTTVKHLSSKDVAAISFSLPSLEEQKRISSMLTKQMVAVEKARATAQERLAEIKALPAAYLREVFEGSEASRWPLSAIADLSETCSGATPSRSSEGYYGGAIPWIKTGELRDMPITDAEERVTERALSETSLRLLPSGTLLIAMYGQGQTRGRTGLLQVAATTNQACFAILPAPHVFEPRFLQFWFQANYSMLRELSEGRGGNQPNLNGVLLRSLKVPLPSLIEQQRAVAHLERAFRLAKQAEEVAEAELSAVQDLPAMLLRDAFNGEPRAAKPTVAITPHLNPLALRAAMAAMAAHAWGTQRRRSGKVKLMKNQSTMSGRGFGLGGGLSRAPLGPHDPEFDAVIAYAIEQQWLTAVTDPGQEHPTYVAGPNADVALALLEPLLGERRIEAERLQGLMLDWKKKRAERVATLYSAWNDLLLDSPARGTIEPQAIVHEVLHNWHRVKEERFTEAELLGELAWMRSNDFVPLGQGPRTQGGQGSFTFDAPR